MAKIVQLWISIVILLKIGAVKYQRPKLQKCENVNEFITIFAIFTIHCAEIKENCVILQTDA